MRGLLLIAIAWFMSCGAPGPLMVEQGNGPARVNASLCQRACAP